MRRFFVNDFETMSSKKEAFIEIWAAKNILDAQGRMEYTKLNLFAKEYFYEKIDIKAAF